MTRRRSTRVSCVGVLAGSLLASSVAGCYRSEQSSADTNTNWLSCETDDDCSGGARCVARMCTDEPADAGSTIRRGQGADDAGPSGLSSADASVGTGAPDALHDGPADAGVVPIGARTLTIASVREPDGSFVISDPAGQAGHPTVRFMGDHFAVAYFSGLLGGPDERIEIARVYGDRIEIDWQAYDGTPIELSLAPDGSLAVRTYLDDPAHCGVDFFPPRLSRARETLALPCFEEMFAVAAAASGAQWLIASANEEEVFVGRYDSGAARWVFPQAVAGPRNAGDVLGTALDADDVIVAWGNVPELGDEQERVLPYVGTSIVARVESVGTGTPGGGSPARRVTPVAAAAHSDGAYGLTAIAGRTLMFGADGTKIWSAAFDGQGEPPAIHEVAPTGVSDRAIGIAPVPERELVGLSYATGPGPWGGAGDEQDGVSFVIVDAAGLPVSEPQVIAEKLANIGATSVAWSGEEFLVVWWDIEHHAVPAFSGIRALRVPGPQ